MFPIACRSPNRQESACSFPGTPTAADRCFPSISSRGAPSEGSPTDCSASAKCRYTHPAVWERGDRRCASAQTLRSCCSLSPRSVLILLPFRETASLLRKDSHATVHQSSSFHLLPRITHAANRG